MMKCAGRLELYIPKPRNIKDYRQSPGVGREKWYRVYLRASEWTNPESTLISNSAIQTVRE